MMRTISLGAATLGAAVLMTWFTPDDKLLGDSLMLLALLVCVNFTFWYVTKARWKLLNAGRSLLYVFLALDFVLLQNSLSVWVGTDYFGRHVVRSMMYLSIVVSVIDMSYTLWQIFQRPPRPVPPGVKYIDEIDGDSLTSSEGSVPS